MRAPAEIPVDLFNPGQVFACLGFLEAAETLLGEAEGGFVWRDGPARFLLRAKGAENAFAEVVGFLSRAQAHALAPEGSRNSTEKWDVETLRLRRGEAFPFSDPNSPATLPALLGDGERGIIIDYWGDATRRDNVKFWAGAGGYPGAALARDALGLVQSGMTIDLADPFAAAAPQSSSFRLDWRRDYIPLDAGFSPNDHTDVKMVGYPLVELLAAIGLTHARPQRIDKLTYRYGVMTLDDPPHRVDAMLLRAALGGAELPFRRRSFLMRLGWPGQENQARCITHVEETPQ
ncbi:MULTISPECIES: type I-G CRISPR-associated protein Cas8g2 [Methylosinus]|uniref:Type I-U CRISPR-associated protein Cas8c n=1 Tax=Methylosinus trichosporium (strain ATCC 35070 / NCIMB 11131 / UNIQEM 75 / OB3b) TaxID=595536 RepID=A0A2D2CXM8_METT3|nr:MULTISPECIES: type I-U CRISPR-associated protein Cas8c [Methylosinus]ATQ67463.1 type I-U CRISPR-associated protein Cas8c [Methylosinus trichosporium OB3b]OBS50878.1 type I-U CRISPR-associated protein Cas8c [Methylosinus sp. 3S-1]